MNVKQISRALHTLSLLSNEDYDLVLKFRALTEDERGLLVMVLEPSRPAGKKAATERKIEHCVACDYTKRALVHKDPNADGYHEFQSARGEKKASKSAQSSSPKSPRASGIHAQLKERRQEQRETTKDDDYGGGEQRCTVLRGDLGGTVCGLLPDHNVHHLQSSRGFHPFVSTAPPAPGRSPANGASSATERSTRRSAPPSTLESDDDRESGSALSSIVGSETGSDGAGNVPAGLSGSEKALV